MSNVLKPKNRPVGLLILDGWGHREETENNAIALAKTPNWDKLCLSSPHTLIKTSGLAVGLPEGQMGNSEVGHMNIGAGRVVYQELTRIQQEISNKDFFKREGLLKAINLPKDNAVHILGLVSDGGVHSHITHIKASVKLSVENGAKTFVHVFTDGRDTSPQSAIEYVEELERYMMEIGGGKIASIVGRFYAMDRDNRWDRVQKAFDLITLGRGEFTNKSALQAINDAYARKETDEFIRPVAITQNNGDTVKINDEDSVIFMNFRSDRARQLTRAFIEKDFSEFKRGITASLSVFVTLTEYHEDFKKNGVLIVYKPQKIINTFGEVIAKNSLKQLRIAETEKYAHVTFFFNGGIETPNNNEDRILVNSPQVKTYDMQPEMSLPELTKKLVKAIKSNKYDTFICNIANPDMVGHTGNFEACIKAVEAVDIAIKEILQAINEVNGEILITADHGNMEMLVNPETGKPLTSHTTFPVPLVYVGHDKQKTLRSGGALADLAPTLLDMLGLTKPNEMTGETLIN